MAKAKPGDVWPTKGGAAALPKGGFDPKGFAQMLWARGLVTSEQCDDIQRELESALAPWVMIALSRDKVVTFDPLIVTNLDNVVVYKAPDGHVYYVIDPSKPIPGREGAALEDAKLSWTEAERRGHFDKGLKYGFLDYDTVVRELARERGIDMSTITGDEKDKPFDPAADRSRDFRREEVTRDDAPETRTPNFDWAKGVRDVADQLDSHAGIVTELTQHTPGPDSVLTPGVRDVKIQLAALFTLLTFVMSLIGANRVSPERLQNVYEAALALVTIIGPLSLAIPVLRKALTSRGKVESNTVNALATVQAHTPLPTLVTPPPERPLAIFDAGFGKAPTDPPPRNLSDVQITAGFERINGELTDLRATVETVLKSETLLKTPWATREDIEAHERRLEQIETYIGALSKRLSRTQDVVERFSGPIQGGSEGQS